MMSYTIHHMYTQSVEQLLCIVLRQDPLIVVSVGLLSDNQADRVLSFFFLDNENIIE